MNKLLIALTAGLLASSAAFAQTSAPASTAPAAAPAVTAPASAKAAKAKKVKHVRIHKAKQPAAPVQAGPNGNKQ